MCPVFTSVGTVTDTKMLYVIIPLWTVFFLYSSSDLKSQRSLLSQSKTYFDVVHCTVATTQTSTSSKRLGTLSTCLLLAAVKSRFGLCLYNWNLKHKFKLDVEGEHLQLGLYSTHWGCFHSNLSFRVVVFGRKFKILFHSLLLIYRLISASIPKIFSLSLKTQRLPWKWRMWAAGIVNLSTAFIENGIVWVTVKTHRPSFVTVEAASAS